MEAPSLIEVYEAFFEKLKDEKVSRDMTAKFMQSNQRNDWTIKKGKKRVPMKSWKGAINTWVRNMPKYSKKELIEIKAKTLFG